MKRRRRFLFPLLSIVLGVIAALVLAEIGLRLFAPQPTGPVQYAWNPDLAQVHVPLQHGRRTIPGVYTYTYSNNSLGIRGTREYDAGKKPGTRRILLLGDSFTYGVGVNDDETFGAVTERLLDSSGVETEVINAGVGGTGTDYALNFFLKVGRSYEPDVVALFFYWNDFIDNSNHSFVLVDGLPVGTARNPIEGKRFTAYIPGYDWLVSWSHLANLLKQAGIRLRGSVGGEDTPGGLTEAKLWFPSPEDRGEAAALLRTLRREVERTGARFLLYHVATEREVEDRRAGRDPSPTESYLADVARADGLTFISLTEPLAGSGLAVKDLYYPERHWTPAAHRIVAEALAAEIGRSALR